MLVIVEGSTFIGNNGEYGGAVSMTGASVVHFENNVYIDNYGVYGTFYLDDQSTLMDQNSIIQSARTTYGVNISEILFC